MSPGNLPPEHSFGTDPELSQALDAISGLGAGRFEVLGPLGKDREGEYAFLARGLGSERLVVLKRRLVGSVGATNSAVLQVIERLDASVPPPAGSCAFCHAPFSNWEPACPDCGADVVGSNVVATSEAERARLLSAVRNAAPTYEVLGDMSRASGGGIVFFAREPGSGQLVALQLEQGVSSGGTGEADRGDRLTVAATRMMRSPISYGSSDSGRSEAAGSWGASRQWAPANSPSTPMRSGALDRPETTGGQGLGTGPKVCPQCGDEFEPHVRFCPRDGSVLRAKERTEDLVGQVIAERYHILRLLGEGGMGRVYLAEHVRMGRTCAVKVMNPKLLNDADSVSRFNREAANASRITHHNVAAIYDFGETQDIVYLAMEYVDGPSLASILSNEHRLHERRAIGIGVQVADALAAAHDFGIVHRDLKPDNIMLTRSRTGDDLVKVVDFGIAKATQGDRQTVTRTGFVIGTPAYMSPEQIMGDTVDGRSDIYSLGCILYEMLTGERVFAGTSGEVSIHQRLTKPAPRQRLVHRDVSKSLDDVVNKALARSPDDRFPSAIAVREALAAALPDSSDAPSQPASTMLRHRSARAHGLRPAWVLAASAGLVGVFVVGALLLRPHPATEASEPVKIPATPTGPIASNPAVPAPPEPTPVTGRADVDSGKGGAPSASNAAGTPGAVIFDEPLPVGAHVTVDRKEATVSADGAIALAPGRHSIVVRVPGFRAFSQSVRIAAGDTTSLAFQLTPEAPAPEPSKPRAPPAPTTQPVPATPGTIVIRGALPEGSAIDVDGRPLAIGVRSASVAPGSHWVRVSVPGYRSDSSQVEVASGQEIGWTAPNLVALVKPAPSPAAGVPREGSSADGPAPKPSPTAPPPAPEDSPSDDQIRAEIVTLLSDFERAINAKNIDRLKTLFPGMAAESERRWRDLFGKDVNDLKAVVTLTNVVPASAAQIATFKVLLTFKPNGGKPQRYQMTDVGTVRREAAGWRFIDLLESGS